MSKNHPKIKVYLVLKKPHLFRPVVTHLLEIADEACRKVVVVDRAEEADLVVVSDLHSIPEVRGSKPYAFVSEDQRSTPVLPHDVINLSLGDKLLANFTSFVKKAKPSQQK